MVDSLLEDAISLENTFHDTHLLPYYLLHYLKGA